MVSLSAALVLGLVLQVATAEFSELDNTFLKYHNEVRTKHGASALELDADLTKLAQERADHMAEVGKLLHNKEHEHGENVVGIMHKSSITLSEKTGIHAVHSWYKEARHHDFTKNTLDPHSKHFTQLVWKATKHVGCGCTKSKTKEEIFCACEYSPAGNQDGEFLANVGNVTE